METARVTVAIIIQYYINKLLHAVNSGLTFHTHSPLHLSQRS